MQPPTPTSSPTPAAGRGLRPGGGGARHEELALAELSELVRLLDVDPDLGRDLDPQSARTARDHAVAWVQHVDERALAAHGARDGQGHLGLLMLDGLVCREIGVRGRRSIELWGPADLLRPGDAAPSLQAQAGGKGEWTVLEPARAAVLDNRFAARIARWPTLAAALARRATQRSNWLLLHLGLCHRRRVEARLLMLFWLLAERWGRVCLDGTRIPLRLSHDLLARLIGAQRPSVTGAVAALHRQGLLSRRADGSWTIHALPEDLRRLVEGHDRALAVAAAGGGPVVPTGRGRSAG